MITPEDSNGPQKTLQVSSESSIHKAPDLGGMPHPAQQGWAVSLLFSLRLKRPESSSVEITMPKEMSLGHISLPCSAEDPAIQEEESESPPGTHVKSPSAYTLIGRPLSGYTYCFHTTVAPGFLLCL